MTSGSAQPPAPNPVAAPPVAEAELSAPSGDLAAWPKPRLSRVDSPTHTLFGLVVIWIALWLVFTANRWSESYVRVAPGGIASGAGASEQDHALIMALEPRAKILQPIELHFPRMSTAEALKTLGSYVRLNINPANLKLVDGDSERSIAFRGEPLYRVIHQLLGDEQLGFALRVNDLQVFEQQLTITGGEPLRDMRWKAQLELTPQRLLVFPSGHAPLWLSLRLSGSVEQDTRNWQTVQVEIWRGGELLTVAQAPLNAQGQALLSTTSTADKVALKIEREGTTRPDRPASYGIDFHYESF